MNFGSHTRGAEGLLPKGCRSVEIAMSLWLEGVPPASDHGARFCSEVLALVCTSKSSEIVRSTVAIWMSCCSILSILSMIADVEVSVCPVVLLFIRPRGRRARRTAMHWTPCRSQFEQGLNLSQFTFRRWHLSHASCTCSPGNRLFMLQFRSDSERSIGRCCRGEPMNMRGR